MKSINIKIKEQQKFFQEFKCEVLTENTFNQKLIEEFTSKIADNSLEEYLKDKAWEEDSDGETRVYLVKDESGQIALFFSLKCGLLVGKDTEERLSEGEKTLLDLITDAKKAGDEEALKGYYDFGIKEVPDIDFLFRIADERIESKNESREIGQEGNTLNVPKCISAIELRHFCKNESYRLSEKIKVPIGFGVFWEKIVPIVLEVTKKIGCKYLYLFAADKTKDENDPGTKRLISYYKNTLKFYECSDDLKFVKPAYDNNCYGLVQDVSKLSVNRDAVWEEFSDAL